MRSSTIIIPHQLTPWLEAKAVEHLFFAGQINGTTGYEKRPAKVSCRDQRRAPDPWRGARDPGRDDAYIGVLVTTS